MLRGSLAITSNRVGFLAATEAFWLRLQGITNCVAKGDAVEVLASGKRGGIHWFWVDRSHTVTAILTAAVQVQNRQLAENFDSERSRRIPEAVKSAVWRRDGGQCVQCAARDYLEFDHIIPFSKGGSNHDKNIQLLCRKCNLAKSDLI
jgi:5-methylcytosine-specific restriction endonuclease McrA